MNETFVVVKVDISNKQKYIFNSNVLKEIIGASKIIKFVSEKLGDYVLEKLKLDKRQFAMVDGKEEFLGNKLFAAGGNSMYIFKNRDEAKAFNKLLSKIVMKHFDSLDLIIVLKDFNLHREKITNLYDEIEAKITAKKGSRKNQFRRIGYGLTETCSSTGKPAGFFTLEGKMNDKVVESSNGSEKKGKYISKEINDKLQFYNYAKNGDRKAFKYFCQLENELSKAAVEEIMKLDVNEEINISKDYSFTDEVLKLAGNYNKDGGYIGVTCIDGNGMGKKIKSFNENFEKLYKEQGVLKTNLQYIDEFDNLTKSIDSCYKEAFKELVEELNSNFHKYSQEINYEEKIMPIRPIIFAGDDITILSNGKMTVDITKRFVEKISAKEVAFNKGKKENLTVSAGIAIVKEKHPLFRAVSIAELLQKNAKVKLQNLKNAANYDGKDNYEASIIDWQIDRGNLIKDIKELRKLKYSEEELVGRPYIVWEEHKFMDQELNEENKKVVHYKFSQFEKVMKKIKKKDNHGNIKSFFRAMNLSNVDFQLFAYKYELKDNKENKKQVLYDVIDIMDLYTYVKGDEENA